MHLEILTVEKIRSWAPCYDVMIEFEYIPEDWTGTIVDILDMDIEHEHKLWCIRKSGILSIRAWQEFAIFCAYQALSYIENPDPHSIAALKAAELYLNEKITREEMQIAVNRVSEPVYTAANLVAYYAVTATYYAIKHNGACAIPEAEAACATRAINAARAANSAANAARTANDSRLKQIAKLKELIMETTK